MAALSSMVQGKSGLLLISKIPMDSVAWLSGEKVEVNHLVFDEKDNRIDSKRWKIDFSRFPQNEIYQYSCLSVSPGTYKCRVVIRHPESGKSAVALSKVTISGNPESGLVLDSPLLLLPRGNALYLQGVTSEERVLGKKYSVLLAHYPYDASHYSPLLGELPQGSSNLFAVVRCSFFKIENPKIMLYCRAVNEASGEEISLKFSSLKSQRDNDSLTSFIELHLGELLPGSYKLVFVEEEVNTNLSSVAIADLTVKQEK